MSTGEIWEPAGPGHEENAGHMAGIMAIYDEGFVDYGQAHDETAVEINELMCKARELAQQIQGVQDRVGERFAGLGSKRMVAQDALVELGALASTDGSGRITRVLREVSVSASQTDAERFHAEEVVKKLGAVAAGLHGWAEDGLADASMLAMQSATHGAEAQRSKDRAIGQAK